MPDMDFPLALMKQPDQIMNALLGITVYRKLETIDHIRRCRRLTEILLGALKSRDIYRNELSQEVADAIVRSVIYHDIGKAGLPDSILLKPGPLTKEEFDVVCHHCNIGGDIVDPLVKTAETEDDRLWLSCCSDICRFHHERWDGRGYPNGLEKDRIPLAARIYAFADVYDALVNSHSYKPNFSHGDALTLLNQGRGTQFDPEIVDAAMEADLLISGVTDGISDMKIN